MRCVKCWLNERWRQKRNGEMNGQEQTRKEATTKKKKSQIRTEGGAISTERNQRVGSDEGSNARSFLGDHRH